ncbi:coiled-coil domain-containing protein 120 isoform X6 [Elephas maximus indicus]|uniref:coiled-coil domain-containing protein 120 isoform X6 n=1 Tax=Elephas maximus indicus TaxID=99487 RepID=UPI0021170940|nr:coiled-coil domain-containing protein 120 isoform X6 [Elephas maximus indicus]
MEVKGQLISSPTFNAPAALFGEAAPHVKSERLRGLLDRQRALQEALSLKLQELRKVCLQEAELTGQLPPECPLEPGERPQLVRRRPPAACTYAPSHPNPAHHSLCPAEELALDALEREVSVQQQIAAAARRLALVPELSAEQRRRRRQVQADALRRLHELEEQLGDVQARLGLPVLPPPQPLPLSMGAVITTQGVCLGTRLAQLSQEDVVLHSESSSLSESGASHDNEEPRGCLPLAERPSPPKAWDQLWVVSGGSPERRAPWKPPPSDLYGDLKSRRNSVASPTSPTRSLPRSASSFEGRSVPATPVLTRGIGPQLCKPEGLHSRQWSSSQDSQLAPQTLPGLPGPAQLPLPPAGAPGTHLCVGTSSWTIPWNGACPAVVAGQVGGSCYPQLRSQDPSPDGTGPSPCSQAHHLCMQLMVAVPSSAARTPMPVPPTLSPVACPWRPLRVWRYIQPLCCGCPHPPVFPWLVSAAATRTLHWRGCGTGTSGTQDWLQGPSAGLCFPTWAHHTNPSSMPAPMRWARCCMGPPARRHFHTQGVSQRPLSPAGTPVMKWTM